MNYKKLRAKCRTLNVTINSAIATAITAVLQKDDGMEAIVPINTRSLLGFNHDKGAANFASSIRPFLTYCYDDDFWSNVIRVNNDINKAKNDVHKVLENLYSFLKLDENIFGVGYHARYGCFRDFDLVMTLRDALSLDSSKESFDISNIGKINFDNLPKDYKISNCYYIPNYTVACDCTFGSVSMNKIMSLTLSIPSTRISVEEGKEILEKVISYLVAYL